MKLCGISSRTLLTLGKENLHVVKSI
jgi:hypothetical protein